MRDMNAQEIASTLFERLRTLYESIETSGCVNPAVKTLNAHLRKCVWQLYEFKCVRLLIMIESISGKLGIIGGLITKCIDRVLWTYCRGVTMKQKDVVQKLTEEEYARRGGSLVPMGLAG